MVVEVKRKKNEKTNAVYMRLLCSMCGVSRKGRCRDSDVRERGGLEEDVVAGAERADLSRGCHIAVAFLRVAVISFDYVISLRVTRSILDKVLPYSLPITGDLSPFGCESRSKFR
ncbi:hypothetical protein EVAR_86829_1 [Eumeta japonica]|uniref:Uncharacterized protein n=1 Tax=Eumeta variegata TaxID=151549 RepID=A0A4C1VUK8_EUMVA|nr:hypothetical protein EVAR_86829_1 [Eumeta japonica]